jgi:hypothetical protein
MELVKDPELLIPWLQTARNLLAIEMESGRVYRAVELMRYVEQQNQLEQLARIVQQMVSGGGPASSDPR